MKALHRAILIAAVGVAGLSDNAAAQHGVAVTRSAAAFSPQAIGVVGVSSPIHRTYYSPASYWDPYPYGRVERRYYRPVRYGYPSRHYYSRRYYPSRYYTPISYASPYYYPAAPYYYPSAYYPTTYYYPRSYYYPSAYRWPDRYYYPRRFYSGGIWPNYHYSYPRRTYVRSGGYYRDDYGIWRGSGAWRW